MALLVWKLPVEYARTLAFTTTVLFEFFLVFTIRSEKSAFEIGFFSSKLLLLAVVFGVVGQLFTIYHPLGNEIFNTVPLNWNDWILVLICASSGFVIIESLKVVKEKFPNVGRLIPTN